MLRRSDERYDHGTPIPVDLNVSGHRQHGVFSTKTGPCKPTVIQPEAGVELPPYLEKAERTDRQCVCGVEVVVIQVGTSARPSTAVMEQSP